MDLHGKTALVTGGAVRIGKAICLALAGEGANVIIHCNRAVQNARALQDDLMAKGVRSFVAHADLMDDKAPAELMELAVSAAGNVDILVNNAAVFHKESLVDVTAQSLRAEFQPNLFAPMLLIREFARRMKNGAIVNLLDRRIASQDADCVPYLLSKKALAELTKVAALALAPGIRVNGVAPGPVLAPPGKGEDYLRDHAGPVPLQRSCTPEDVAQTVISLLKNDAVTGQIVFVDGGQHLLGNLPAPPKTGVSSESPDTRLPELGGD